MLIVSIHREILKLFNNFLNINPNDLEEWILDTPEVKSLRFSLINESKKLRYKNCKGINTEEQPKKLHN